MSGERTSLVIKTGPGTGPAGSGPSPPVEDQVPAGGEHVVRIRLGGDSGGEIRGGAADLGTRSAERTPVAIRSPDAAEGRRSCTVRITASPRAPIAADPPSGKKSVTVYLQPWSATPVDTNSPLSGSDVGGKPETTNGAMLIKPEEEQVELFYRSSGGGSASSTTGSEAADSGTCSDLDNTSPRPADWRRPRRAASDEDISSATDSLSDHDPDHDHDHDHGQHSQTSPFHDNKDKDDYLVFHLNEKDFDKCPSRILDDQTTFAGRRSLDGESATIRSARGTIRGVKNRVRAGIATFLSINTTKSWQEKEAGQVVVYTTTMGIVRETFIRCLLVRHILRTNVVKFTEKDLYMSRELQTELQDRMGATHVELPQVFIEGLHVGDADTIEKLNESGELRKMLKPYRSMDACTTCQACGGFGLLPCNVCNGSKKSVHRNQFSTELVALRCMHCDEVGLIKCYAC